MILAACDRTIAAPVDVVWELLTTPAGLNEWMSVAADVDLRPGGVLRWEHENGHVVSGEVREVVPMRRFVFTYGWESGFLPVPPGSTVVTIELDAAPDATRISVRHAGLTEALADRHSVGWTHFVGRLAERAEEATRRPSADSLLTGPVDPHDGRSTCHKPMRTSSGS